jgi:thermitase
MLRETSLTLLLLCCVPFQDSCCSQQAQDQSYIPGQILVKFHEGVSQEEAHTLHDRLGSTILVHYQKLNIDLVKIKSGLTVEEAIKLYQEDSRVAYAEPNYTRRTRPKISADTP